MGSFSWLQIQFITGLIKKWYHFQMSPTMEIKAMCPSLQQPATDPPPRLPSHLTTAISFKCLCQNAGKERFHWASVFSNRLSPLLFEPELLLTWSSAYLRSFSSCLPLPSFLFSLGSAEAASCRLLVIGPHSVLWILH